jgi:hypothetical protein
MAIPRSVRRDNGERPDQFLVGFANEPGIETPSWSCQSNSSLINVGRRRHDLSPPKSVLEERG